MSEYFLSTVIVGLQFLSLTGVWLEVFSAESKRRNPPLSWVVLALAILSGSSYFVAGICGNPIDWTKVIIGSASVITCGANLSQYWVGKLTPRKLLAVVAVEVVLLAIVALIVSFSGIAVYVLLAGMPIIFAFSQAGGRAVQIVRFAMRRAKSASLTLWVSNVLLNVALIIYHNQRSEDWWLVANIASLLMGLVVLFQVIMLKLRSRCRDECHSGSSERFHNCDVREELA